MYPINLRVARRDDFRELSAWLVNISQTPQQHCLHTWSGQSTAGLEGQLLGYFDDAELSYLLAERDGQLIGAIGSEFDLGLKRVGCTAPM